MNRELRFGIIGFGKIGPRHGEKIEENKHCKLRVGEKATIRKLSLLSAR
jgi:homoserine dehydrogenase